MEQNEDKPIYGIYFPETGNRCAPWTNFESVEDADRHFSNKPIMNKIKESDGDLSAWMNTATGDIFVIREVKE